MVNILFEATTLPRQATINIRLVLEIRRKIADGNDDYLPHNRVYGIVKAKEIGETSCHSYSCKWGSGRKGSTGKPQIVFRHFMTTTPQVL
jgi:hypothetical protein